MLAYVYDVYNYFYNTDIFYRSAIEIQLYLYTCSL